MELTKNLDSTWTFTAEQSNDLSEKFRIVSIIFNEEEGTDTLKLASRGMIEIDRMDGSSHDSDGDEKQLLLVLDDKKISFTTLPEDFRFWQNTENVTRKGGLGYVKELLNNSLKAGSDMDVYIDSENVVEAFLWTENYINEYHPTLLDPTATKKYKP